MKKVEVGLIWHSDMFCLTQSEKSSKGVKLVRTTKAKKRKEVKTEVLLDATSAFHTLRIV